MLRFLLRRLLLLVPVLVGLTLLVFAIARLLPGDPVGLAAGPNASRAEIADVARDLPPPEPAVETESMAFLLQGFNRAYTARRQRVLKGVSPDEMLLANSSGCRGRAPART